MAWVRGIFGFALVSGGCTANPVFGLLTEDGGTSGPVGTSGGTTTITGGESSEPTGADTTDTTGTTDTTDTTGGSTTGPGVDPCAFLCGSQGCCPAGAACLASGC